MSAIPTMAVAMLTQTARIPWDHLAVLVSQDIMATGWIALVRKCFIFSTQDAFDIVDIDIVSSMKI